MCSRGKNLRLSDFLESLSKILYRLECRMRKLNWRHYRWLKSVRGTTGGADMENCKNNLKIKVKLKNSHQLKIPKKISLNLAKV